MLVFVEHGVFVETAFITKKCKRFGLMLQNYCYSEGLLGYYSIWHDGRTLVMQVALLMAVGPAVQNTRFHGAGYSM